MSTTTLIGVIGGVVVLGLVGVIVVAQEKATTQETLWSKINHRFTRSRTSCSCSNDGYSRSCRRTECPARRERLGAGWRDYRRLLGRFAEEIISILMKKERFGLEPTMAIIGIKMLMVLGQSGKINPIVFGLL